jgi:hypothetical protein
VGYSRTISPFIRNTGQGTLSLTGTSAVSIDDPATPDQFSVTRQPGSTEIPAGVGIAFDLGFAPTTTGAKTATVTILSDDPDEGTYQLTITGIGTSTVQGHVTLSEALGAAATAKVCVDTSYKASPAYSTTVDLTAGATGFDYTVDAVPDGSYFIWTYVDTNANAIVGDPGDHLGTYGDVDPNLTAVNAVIDWTHRSGFDISTTLAQAFNSVTDASEPKLADAPFVDIVAGQCTVNWAVIYCRLQVLSIPDQLLFDNHLLSNYTTEYEWWVRLDLNGDGLDDGDFDIMVLNIKQASEVERLVARANILANTEESIYCFVGTIGYWRAYCSGFLETDNTIVVGVQKYAHSDLKNVFDTTQVIYGSSYNSGTSTYSDWR